MLHIVRLTMWTVYTLVFLSVSPTWTAQDFVRQVVLEMQASSVQIRYDYCPETWLQRLLESPPQPVVLQSLKIETPPSEQFSRLLQIICLESVQYSTEQLTSFLEQAHGKVKSIFYITTTVSNFSSQRVLHSLLKRSYQLKMLNIIAVLAEDADRSYYRYRPYPRFELEQRSLDQRPFFETLLTNMHGQPLIVLPDHNPPRIIIYTDWRTGAQVMVGSVGRFVRTLAWKLNATIKFPIEIKPGVGLHFDERESLVKEHQVDLPATVVQLMEQEQMTLTSLPLEMSHICLMIPLAQQQPIKDIYLILFDLKHILVAFSIVYIVGLLLCMHRRLAGEPTSLVDFLLNDVALRGVLGQSYGRVLQTSIYFSWFYLLLAVFGLNLSSIHEAALGTLLTHPPKYFQPRSFADVRRAKLPLAVDAADAENFYGLSDPALRVVRLNSSEYNSQRDKMNMSHVYYASRLSWMVLSEQQKYFPREVFLFSKKACVRTHTYLVFQLPKHSWFLEPINKLILEVRDYGIFTRWAILHFYDMAAAGLLSFSDPIQRKPQRTKEPLHFEDLQWIWIAYVTLLILATIVLALEMITKRLQQRLRKVNA